MYHYIYKIINNINGNFYIGRRSSKDLPEKDPYFGSGKILKQAIEKNGKENFSKIILETTSTYEELVQREKEIITEELVVDSKCYNLALGGHGGFTFYENRTFRHTDASKQKISNANKGRKRDDVRERMLNNQYAKGLQRTEEDKTKKSLAAYNRLAYNKTDFNTKVTCPYCNKQGQLANMKRWHFDNCKQNPKFTT